jgi:cytidylate kinase
VFNNFVAESAPCQVNIDAVARQRIQRRLAEAPEDLFANAQQQVYEPMKYDSFWRFEASRLHPSEVAGRKR